MSITAKNEGRSLELCPSGAFIGLCFYLAHLGTARDVYKGKEKIVNRFRIGFELPTEQRVFDATKGLQPFAIYKELTLSMHPKSALRALLEAWRNKMFSEEEAKSFDVSKLLGIPCMLNII